MDTEKSISCETVLFFVLPLLLSIIHHIMFEDTIEKSILLSLLFMIWLKRCKEEIYYLSLILYFQVCKTTKRVIAQCPALKVNLSDYLTSLNELKDTASKRSNELGFNRKQTKMTLDNIKTNISRVEDTLQLIDESLRITDKQFKKIKNAMMW